LETKINMYTKSAIAFYNFAMINNLKNIFFDRIKIFAVVPINKLDTEVETQKVHLQTTEGKE